MTEATKKIKKKAKFFSFLSFCLTILPIIIFIIIGYAKGGGIEKIGLTCSVMIAIILVLINIVFKYHIRSTIWVLTLGIYFCLENIASLLIITAISTILDEFIIYPLKNKYKMKLTINKEIDARGE